MAKPMDHIKDLTPDPRNARRHNPRNEGMLEQSLREVGAARSIVIDEDGVVLAGNATVNAAAAAGIERMRVVDADGEEIIAVRRTGLTPEQKRRLAIFDNRTAELADWDPAILSADLDAGVDLGAWWFPEELDALVSGLAVPDFAPVGIEEQGRLDQKAPVTCPECGHEFAP